MAQREKRFVRTEGKGMLRRAQKSRRLSEETVTETQLSGDDVEHSEFDIRSPVIRNFLLYQVELDTKHDKYERLVKYSRDATIESKRIIFLLHRIKNTDYKENSLKEAEQRLRNLKTGLLKRIATELMEEDPYHFLRAYSSGIQEFIEAITFYFYEKEKRLVSLQQLNEDLERDIFEDLHQNGETPEDERSAFIHPDLRISLSQLFQPSDYILGIADLTGELMRKCIAAIGAGQVEIPFELCSFLRRIYEGFVAIGNQGPREISRKLYTLKQSLGKVEMACYTLQVRGSEIPRHMLADVLTSRQDHEFQRDEIDSMYD